MAVRIKVEDGYIREYDEWDACRNSYGGNVKQAIVSGNRIIALTQAGMSIDEYENNCVVRSYGLQNGAARQIVVSGNKLIAIMEHGGSIYEYEDGCFQRNYSCNVESVLISGDTVIARISDGRTDEYENGMLVRSY